MVDDDHLISATYSINFSAKVTHSAYSLVIFISQLVDYQEYKMVEEAVSFFSEQCHSDFSEFALPFNQQV